jgi:hypothetical protein
VVLAQMAKGNIITEKEKETQSLPITLDFKLESHRRIKRLISESTFVIT